MFTVSVMPQEHLQIIKQFI